MEDHDAIVVGAGHNGLVAATLLARAGYRVLALERSEDVGGAAVSASPFAGLDARISRYSYLVSLFPQALLSQLGVRVALRRRRVSSYTPCGDAGVLVDEDADRTRASVLRTLGSASAVAELERFGALTGALAERIFPTLTEPLPARASLAGAVRARLAAGAGTGLAGGWESVFERPLSELLEASFESDLVRGIVATDALIGTFAALDDPGLAQNRCFLYHVIGNGTGRWDVPVGGMGALTDSLAAGAREAGVQLRTQAPVVAIESDGRSARVRTADGCAYRARHVLCGAAPAVLDGLLGNGPPDGPAPEGSQLKLNLLLRRLPRLRDEAVCAEDAFAGTFHVNESYSHLHRAHEQAAAGTVPELPPCEAYCHSLTDPSILGPRLRASGAQTLTVFALHMPARLFEAGGPAAKQLAVDATLRSLDSVLAEPIEDCLARTGDGEPCLEALTPVELEDELAMPGGHIFHRDLRWPFAESDDEVGRWGVETDLANVWLCGAGARRGGAVSGIPGHNAARAVIESDATYDRCHA